MNLGPLPELRWYTDVTISSTEKHTNEKPLLIWRNKDRFPSIDKERLTTKFDTKKNVAHVSIITLLRVFFP